MYTLDQIFKDIPTYSSREIRGVKQLYARAVYENMIRKTSLIQKLYERRPELFRVLQSFASKEYGATKTVYRILHNMSEETYATRFNFAKQNDIVTVGAYGNRKVFSWAASINSKYIRERSWVLDPEHYSIILRTEIPVSQILFSSDLISCAGLTKYISTKEKQKVVTNYYKEQEVTVIHNKPIKAVVFSARSN